MSASTKAEFDTNFNMRANQKDKDAFYAACANNGEPSVATVVRRMMTDYVEGSITYNVTQEDY